MVPIFSKELFTSLYLFDTIPLLVAKLFNPPYSFILKVSWVMLSSLSEGFIVVECLLLLVL